jgi:hypothetical protein
MESHTPGYSRSISRLLEDEDLAGLLAMLRQPARPDLRGEAALALADLGDPEATELLVRATREDPETGVRAAAQQALTAMFGSEAASVIASYGAAFGQDAWLLAPQESDAGEKTEGETGLGKHNSGEIELKLSESEVESFARVARYESSQRLRLQAIRVLGHSANPSEDTTDVLAELTLFGDAGEIRQAARQALENLYGDDSAGIIENYRSSALDEAYDSGTEEELLNEMELENEPAEDEQEDESGMRTGTQKRKKKMKRMMNPPEKPLTNLPVTRRARPAHILTRPISR